jgi:hypothetical protein
MTPLTPSPYSYEPATRTRVKWDNIAIVLMGAVVATFAVAGIMMTADKPAAKPAPKQVAPATSNTLEDAIPTGDLTLDDATALIEEARDFMGQARWDEAADRLATIPAEFRDQVQASGVEAELTTLHARHDKLRAELNAAVEANQWKDAKAVLVQLAKIAPLDAELEDIAANVDEHLGLVTKPASATKADAAAPATDTATSANASGGGATTATHNHAATTTKPTTSRPSSGTSRPSNTSTTRPGGTSGGGGSTSTSNTTGSGTVNVGGTTLDLDDLGNVQISDEELEAALAQLGGTTSG